MSEPTAGQPAICAVHSGQPATSVCARCGNFMCDECSEARTSPHCPRCREVVGASTFPLNRADWSFNALMSYSWDAFRREWLMLSLGVLIFFAVAMGVNLLGQLFQGVAGASGSVALVVVISVLFTLATSVVQGALQMGLIRMALDVHAGGKAEVGRVFSQFSKIWKYLGQILFIGLVVGLPMAAYAGVVAGIVYLTGGFQEEPRVFIIIGVATLPLIPVIIYASLGLVFAQMELTNDDDVGPVEAIKRSWDIARGERLSIFGVTVVAGLIGGLGVLACCVGVLASFALSQLILVGLYLALRNRPGSV